MSNYDLKLSTTQPNHVEFMEFRQDDILSRTLNVAITSHDLPRDLTGYDVFLNSTLPSRNIARDKVTNFIDKVNGKFSYTLIDSFVQDTGRVATWFSIEKGGSTTQVGEVIDSTTNFTFSVVPGYRNCVKQGNYIWEFEELLRYVTGLANQSQVQLDKLKTDFDTWFERIKDTLGEDAAGALALAIHDLEDLFGIRNAQVNELGDVLKKIRVGEQVKIACLGDSLTYGYDIYSDDIRPPSSELTDNGTAHVRERASKTYPEALQEFFDNTFGIGKVIIRNMGYSGDTTVTAYQHWNASGADLVITMLGTNDANRSTVEEFADGYRKIIQREQKNGTPVIMLLPPKRRSMSDVKLAAYRTTAIQLANENNIPWVDMAKELANIDYSFYSDDTHFNGKGYTYLGARIFAVISGESVANPVKVANSSLGLRNQIDGCHFYGGVNWNTGGGFPNVSETEGISGNAVYLRGDIDQSVLYTFQTTEDNVVAYPSAYMSRTGQKIQMELDFGLDPQSVSNSNAFGTSESNRKKASVITLTEDDCNYAIVKSRDYRSKTNFHISGLSSLEDKMIFIPKAGFHTIRIKNSGANTFNLFGLEFATLEAVRGVILGNTPNHYFFRTNKIWNDGIVTAKTEIEAKVLMDHFRVPLAFSAYADSPAIQIIVKNYDRNVLIYTVQLGVMTTNSRTSIFGPPQEIKYGNYEGTDHRTLSSVEWENNPNIVNTDNTKLILTWSGNTSFPSTVTIKVL